MSCRCSLHCTCEDVLVKQMDKQTDGRMEAENLCCSPEVKMSSNTLYCMIVVIISEVDSTRLRVENDWLPVTRPWPELVVECGLLWPGSLWVGMTCWNMGTILWANTILTIIPYIPQHAFTFYMNKAEMLYSIHQNILYRHRIQIYSRDIDI